MTDLKSLRYRIHHPCCDSCHHRNQSGQKELEIINSSVNVLEGFPLKKEKVIKHTGCMAHSQRHILGKRVNSYMALVDPPSHQPKIPALEDIVSSCCLSLSSGIAYWNPLRRCPDPSSGPSTFLTLQSTILAPFRTSKVNCCQRCATYPCWRLILGAHLEHLPGTWNVCHSSCDLRLDVFSIRTAIADVDDSLCACDEKMRVGEGSCRLKSSRKNKI